MRKVKACVYLVHYQQADRRAVSKGLLSGHRAIGRCYLLALHQTRRWGLVNNGGANGAASEVRVRTQWSVLFAAVKVKVNNRQVLLL